MTRVLVHLVLHCVFSAGPLKVARSACVCAHAQYVTAHLRCSNQGVVRILLLPGVNAPNVHKCTVVTEKNMMTFMTWQGQRSNPRGSRGQTKRARYSVPYLTQRSKVKPWGKSWGQTKHDRHSVPYLAQRSKVKKCARTCPALTTLALPGFCSGIRVLSPIQSGSLLEIAALYIRARTWWREAGPYLISLPAMLSGPVARPLCKAPGISTYLLIPGALTMVMIIGNLKPPPLRAR